MLFHYEFVSQIDIINVFTISVIEGTDLFCEILYHILPDLQDVDFFADLDTHLVKFDVDLTSRYTVFQQFS